MGEHGNRDASHLMICVIHAKSLAQLKSIIQITVVYGSSEAARNPKIT